MSAPPPPLKPDGGTVTQSLLELRAILENATVGILFTRNRLVVQANPCAAEMWGYGRHDMIGMPGIALFPSPDSYEELGQAIVPLLSAGKVYKGQHPMKRRDGSLFWCSISARALDSSRPTEATIWIMEDVSEDRLIQQALEQTTNELS